MLEQRAERKRWHAPQTGRAPIVELSRSGERFDGLVEFWPGSTMEASLHRRAGTVEEKEAGVMITSTSARHRAARGAAAALLLVACGGRADETELISPFRRPR